MGAQRLSDRSVRRIARSTGLTVVRAWGHGDSVMSFVTDDHRHGWWHRRTGEWGWDDPDGVLLHFTSCEEMFPGYLRDAAGLVAVRVG
jgi:hypothetical protein